MRLSRGEVVVHRHHVPRLDERLRQQVLAGAPLVRRQDILIAEDLPHRVGQPVKTLRPRIRIVGHQHGPLLRVRHGVGAAVGQHVQKDVPGAKQERVVSRFFDCPEPLANRDQPHLLHDANFVHFDRNFGSVG